MTMPENFRFDDRTLKTLLTHFREYSARLPFGDTGHTWDKFFFNDEQDVDTLVALLQDPESAQGKTLPHQAFLLAFFRMLETPRRLMNTLPHRHRDLYFRGVLGGATRAAQPDSVLVQLTPEAERSTLNLPASLLLDGGQDSQGLPLHYQLDNSLLINHARWSDLYWVTTVDDKTFSTVALSLEDKIDFPPEGIRLFSQQENTVTVPAGRLLVLPELAGLTGRGRQLEVAFGSATPAPVSAEIAVQNRWVDLGVGKASKEQNRLLFTLDDALLLSQPTALPDYPFTAPLVRLYTQENTLPAIVGLSFSVQQAADIDLRTGDDITIGQESSYPFGPEPALGNSVKIMSPAWCRPDLTLDITLKPVWQARPADFAEHYKNYPDSAINNGAFKVSGTDLIDAQGTAVQESALFTADAQDAEIRMHRDGADCDPDDAEAYWQHASVLTLAGKDFQQAAWNNMIKQGTLQSDTNPPWIPRWQTLAVSWRAELLNAPQQYRLLSFGWQADDAAAPAPEPTDAYELYLGFDGLTAGQQLSLYWEMDTPVPFVDGGITWHYLAKPESAGEKWQPLTRQISDETGNFSRSGNGYVTLPADATNQGMEMPAGRYWLRASGFIRQEITPDLPEDVVGAEENPQPQVAQFPWLKGLWTNATRATLINSAQAAVDHFTTPLPAGSVSRTVTPVAGLASVSQPLAGTGGMAPESDDAMMTRMANQVAHRGRASTWRDISMLITENFPEVAYVRLPGVKSLDGLYIPDPPNSKKLTEDVPGAQRVQEVMLVPRTGINEGSDPKKPIFTPAYLQKVNTFISERASPWLNLRVLNPYYLTIDVAYEVHWKPGVNPENAEQQLEKAINQHFMPWLTGDSLVTLGSSLTINDIILVMQQQPEVSWVENVTLDEKHDPVDTTLAVMVLRLRSGIITPFPASTPELQRG